MQKVFVLVLFIGFAQEFLGAQAGGNTFFATRTDEDATCILNGDLVTIEAFQPLVKPNGNWLAKGKSGGFVANITVASDTGQPVKHSVMKEVQFVQDDNQKSLVRLNQSMLLTNRLIIAKDGQPTITALTMSFEYIGKKTPTAWGAGLQTMATLATVLPLPASPYTAAAQSLAQLTSNLVANSLQEDKPGTQDPKADLDIPFFGKASLPSGKTRCMGDMEVGAYALVDASPTNGNDDFVDINQPNGYCMSAEPSGGAASVAISFQKRQSLDPSTGRCTGTGAVHTLGNPHIPLLVTAITFADLDQKNLKGEAELPIGIERSKGKLQKEPLGTYSRQARTSLHLCERLRISPSRCLGFDTSRLDLNSRTKLNDFERELLKHE